MRSKQPTGFALVWGAIGPLSVIFGGTIVLYAGYHAQQPSYRVFDPRDSRHRRELRRRTCDRRPHHRRRTVFS